MNSAKSARKVGIQRRSHWPWKISSIVLELSALFFSVSLSPLCLPLSLFLSSSFSLFLTLSMSVAVILFLSFPLFLSQSHSVSSWLCFSLVLIFAIKPKSLLHLLFSRKGISVLILLSSSFSLFLSTIFLSFSFIHVSRNLPAWQNLVLV